MDNDSDGVTVRTTISMPGELLERIDDEALRVGIYRGKAMGRSEFLREAAEEKLSRVKRRKAR